MLLAVPVAATEATLKAIRHLVTHKMLIMDVGSTKRDVVDAARRVLRRQADMISRQIVATFWPFSGPGLACCSPLITCASRSGRNTASLPPA